VGTPKGRTARSTKGSAEDGEGEEGADNHEGGGDSKDQKSSTKKKGDDTKAKAEVEEGAPVVAVLGSSSMEVDAATATAEPPSKIRRTQQI